MDYKGIFTGSPETESELRLFVQNARTLEDGVPRSLFKDAYYWKVMTVGRNGPGDHREGSKARDDTGGFFHERNGLAYLTDKAKDCIYV